MLHTLAALPAPRGTRRGYSNSCSLLDLLVCPFLCFSLCENAAAMLSPLPNFAQSGFAPDVETIKPYVETLHAQPVIIGGFQSIHDGWSWDRSRPAGKIADEDISAHDEDWPYSVSAVDRSKHLT